MMKTPSDKLYATVQSNSPFQFDDKVVAVFPDMIKRSVPGYEQVIDYIQKISRHFVKENTNCYDLGCSLGAASLAMSYGNRSENVNIIGVDNSKAMIERCKSNIDGFKHKTPINLIQQDIQQTEITNASMVVLNYTLQFIPQTLRRSVLEAIFNGLNSGGVLVLSEKVVFEEPEINQLMIELHHQFKRENGYSELEISQKRIALETVMIPETIHQHISRLQDIGFKKVNCYLQQLNFVSLIAIKS